MLRAGVRARNTVKNVFRKFSDAPNNVPNLSKVNPSTKKSSDSSALYFSLFFTSSATITLLAGVKMANDPVFDSIANREMPYFAPYLKMLGELVPEDIRNTISPVAQKKENNDTEKGIKSEIKQDEESAKFDFSPSEQIKEDIKVMDELVDQVADPDLDKADEKAFEQNEKEVEVIENFLNEIVDVETNIPNSAVEESVQVSEPIETLETVIIKDSNVEEEISNKVEEIAVDKNSKGLPNVSSETKMKDFHLESMEKALNEHLLESVTLRKEIESSLLNDLHNLNLDQLKIRVVQLTTELMERSKWEGVRLHQSLKQVETDLSNRYNDLLRQQRNELENEMIRKLHLKEIQSNEEFAQHLSQRNLKHDEEMRLALEKSTSEYKKSLEEELKKQFDEVSKDYQTEMNNQVGLLRNGQIHEQLKIQEDISSLTSQLTAFNETISNLEDVTKRSITCHKESLSLILLENALNNPNKSFVDEVAAVKKNSRDEVILSVLDALPSHLLQKPAPPSLPEIKYRFKVVREEIRKEALSPSSGVFGSAVGSVLASLSVAPDGYIQGDSVEEVLSRVNFLLEKGMLKEAVVEMKNIKGYSKTLAGDWLQLAEDKLIMDQAVKAIKAKNALNHLSVASSHA